MLTYDPSRVMTIPSPLNSTVCTCIDVADAHRLVAAGCMVPSDLKRPRLVKFMNMADGGVAVALKPSTFNTINGPMPIVSLYLSSPCNLFSRTLRLSPSRHGGVPHGYYGFSPCHCNTYGTGGILEEVSSTQGRPAESTWASVWARQPPEAT